MGGAIGGRTALWMLKHPQSDKALLATSRLVQRDRQICMDLYEHKVLTTHQIADLHFDSGTVARRRMLKLFQQGVVKRFRPNLDKGSAPLHFLLGDLGALVVASELGLELRDLKLRPDRLLRIAYSPRLNHLVALNQFFSRLVFAFRQSRSGRLAEWRGEDHCRRQWGPIVLPDAIGRIEASGRQLDLFLELDQGTESPSRLARKLIGYEEASTLSECPALLLFCFPDHAREASARKVLHNCGITIATTAFDRHCAEPLGPNWLTLEAERRISFLHLPWSDAPLRESTQS